MCAITPISMRTINISNLFLVGPKKKKKRKKFFFFLLIATKICITRCGCGELYTAETDEVCVMLYLKEL